LTWRIVKSTWDVLPANRESGKRMISREKRIIIRECFFIKIPAVWGNLIIVLLQLVAKRIQGFEDSKFVNSE
jgi:hypothetical protein